MLLANTKVNLVNFPSRFIILIAILDKYTKYCIFKVPTVTVMRMMNTSAIFSGLNFCHSLDLSYNNEIKQGMYICNNYVLASTNVIIKGKQFK